MADRPISIAQMARAARALEKVGRPVKGLRLHPDGRVDLLTEASGDVLDQDELDRELRAWRAAHGEDRP
jgi:hypothetical protein